MPEGGGGEGVENTKGKSLRACLHVFVTFCCCSVLGIGVFGLVGGGGGRGGGKGKSWECS